MAKWNLERQMEQPKMNEHDEDKGNPVDRVNKPAHYGDGKIECIAYMKDNMDHLMFIGYLEGNTKKYMHRYRYKGKPVEDLRKARWYLDRLITEMEGS